MRAEASGEAVGQGPIFQRASSGLVRQAGPMEALIYNIMFITPGLAIALLLQFLPAFYPGINIYLCVLIGAALCIPTAFVFAMLGSAIPRSGADYVWVSRIMHPALGVMTSFGFTLLWLIYNSLPASLIASLGLSPMFRQIGLMTENTAMVELGNWFATAWGQFIVGTVAMVLFTCLFVFGMRSFFKVQRIIFIVCTAGLALTAVMLLFTSHSGFESGINGVLGHNGYNNVLHEASKEGFVTQSFNLRNTLLGMSWVYLTFVFGISSAYIGSEVQGARRTQLWTIPLATVYSTLWALLFVWLIERIEVMNFIGAADFIGGGQFGSTPSFSELAGYSMPLGIAILIAITFTLWMSGPLPNQMLNTSRNVLAYALDGVVPRQLGDVNERFGAPVINLVFVLVVSIGFLALFRFTEIFATLAVAFAYTLTFGTASLAAVLLPYRRKDIFDASPIKWRWGGIPVVTIVGVLSVACQIFFAWVFLTDPIAGINGHTDILLINIGVFVCGFFVYWIAKAFWGRRGYDLDANFRELPVE